MNIGDKVENALDSALVDQHETEPHDKLVAEVRKLETMAEAIKVWRGVMHTPAYGEWNERGWWERNNHMFGTPQVSNMCREILEALAASDLEDGK